MKCHLLTLTLTPVITISLLLFGCHKVTEGTKTENGHKIPFDRDLLPDSGIGGSTDTDSDADSDSDAVGDTRPADGEDIPGATAKP